MATLEQEAYTHILVVIPTKVRDQQILVTPRSFRVKNFLNNLIQQSLSMQDMLVIYLQDLIGRLIPYLKEIVVTTKWEEITEEAPLLIKEKGEEE